MFNVNLYTDKYISNPTMTSFTETLIFTIASHLYKKYYSTVISGNLSHFTKLMPPTHIELRVKQTLYIYR